jgi:uncharacterized protein (DUF1778 family)
MLAARSRKQYSRLNVRLASEVKLKVDRAAHILGEDLTEFTSRTLSKHADEVIENHEQIILSESDYNFFITELEKPAKKPSSYSIKARDSYREIFEKGKTSS